MTEILLRCLVMARIIQLVTCYDLNTSTASELRKADFSAADIEAVRPIVNDAGGPVPDFPAFRVEITAVCPGGVRYMVWKERTVIVFFAVAWTAEADPKVWSQAETLFLDYFDTFPQMSAVAPPNPEKPASLPWLAIGVPLWPWTKPETNEDYVKLTDFGKRLAWAIVDNP